ncbi:MAG TPA: M23 family metallopeptidase [Marmoricola sp.]|nr:M23 family metallopeptidase [Marmoricola sp.]
MGNHRADHRGPKRAAVDPTPARTTRAARPAGGKRKATKHRGATSPRVLPSAPTVVGAVAILAAAGGAVAFGQGQLQTGENITLSSGKAESLNGTDAIGYAANDARAQALSRDSDRQAQAEAANKQLKAAVDEQSQQRYAQLAQLALSAEKRADQIAKNLWVLPTVGYQLTARFGQSSGLWSHLHTGLDFAAPTGTPIYAVANGVITDAGYDGAYGNKTVETLPDGTEIWYCHQSSIGVSVGEKVTQSEQIGAIGSTGNTTGPHVHIEVRPGGGDPVDPYPEFVMHGVTP